MATTFNPITKQIAIPVTDAAPKNVEDLRAEIREYESSEEGIIFDVIANAEGLTDLTEQTSTSLTLELINSWQIAFSGSGKATVSGGNLVGGIGADPFAAAAGVTIINTLSQAGTVSTVETGVSGLTSAESILLGSLTSIEPNAALIPYLVAKP